MLSLKSVASALVIVASAADVAVPVLVAPAVVLAASTAARAESAGAPILRQQAVPYGDLNLATSAGMARFRNRVKEAAQAVCGPQADLRNFDEAKDYKACIARASRDAMSVVPQEAARPSHAG